ncbi:hypothetical protein QD46_15780 [Paenibacillus polymyxa]|nr:hypothetical protein QD46_15780 [Paenibacillus polymyxa]
MLLQLILLQLNIQLNQTIQVLDRLHFYISSLQVFDPLSYTSLNNLPVLRLGFEDTFYDFNLALYAVLYCSIGRTLISTI